jgi:hypothetical protein
MFSSMSEKHLGGPTWLAIRMIILANALRCLSDINEPLNAPTTSCHGSESIFRAFLDHFIFQA